MPQNKARISNLPRTQQVPLILQSKKIETSTHQLGQLEQGNAGDKTDYDGFR
jgi:hypothetical protein